MGAVVSGGRPGVRELVGGFDLEFPLLEEESIRSLRLCNVTQWFDGDAAGIQTHERAVEAGILGNHRLGIHHLFMTKDSRSVERVEAVGEGTVTRHPVHQGEGALGFFSPKAFCPLSGTRQGEYSGKTA